MKEEEFSRRFPGLSGTLAVAADDTDTPWDQAFRRAIEKSDKSPERRHAMILSLLRECRVLIPLLPDEWDALGGAARKSFVSADDARDWLLSAMSAWEEMLDE